MKNRGYACTSIQIDVYVTANARREDFVSGQYDQEHIKYLVIGRGGAVLAIEFMLKIQTLLT